MVNERYCPGEKAVSMSGCAGFNGPGFSIRGKWLKEVMSRMRGVSYNFASALHYPAVVDVLKPWQTTSNGPLCCPFYVLAVGANQMVLDD